MKKKYLCLTALLVVLIACGILLYANINAPAFRGTCVKNASEYALDIEQLNGTDSHTLSLLAGVALQVHFEVTSGDMTLTIAPSNGEAIYTGNGKTQHDFTVNIAKESDYKINVTGAHAAGNLRICVAR